MMSAHERVIGAFDRAASSYNQYAVLQKRVLAELLGLLRPDHRVRRLVDLGCGTGLALPGLQRFYSQACCVGVDVSFQMSLLARAQSAAVVCADFSDLPFLPASVDVIFSNLSLQWAPDLPVVIRQAVDILSPGGGFYFSILLPGSLMEIAESWRGLRAAAGVNNFVSAAEVLLAFSQVGCVPVLTSEKTEVCYHDGVRAACESLRLIGANQVVSQSGTGLLGPRKWCQFEKKYEARRVAAGLPLTYRVMYGVMSKKND